MLGLLFWMFFGPFCALKKGNATKREKCDVHSSQTTGYYSGLRHKRLPLQRLDADHLEFSCLGAPRSRTVGLHPHARGCADAPATVPQ